MKSKKHVIRNDSGNYFTGLLKRLPGGIITNLALSGYLLFLNEFIYDYFFHGQVLQLSSDIIHRGSANPVLGVILILAVAGEFTAYVLKSRYSGYVNDTGAGGFMLWMFHTVVSVIMTIVALGAFGITFDGEMEWLLAILLFATVIKELVILFIIIGTEEPRYFSPMKNFIADMLFLLFYCLAYTVVIGNTLRSDDYNNYLLASHYSVPMMVLNSFLMVLLFMMLYLPLRLPYFLFQRYGSMRGRAVAVMAVLLVAAAAIFPLFEGETSLEKAMMKQQSVEVLFLNGGGLADVPGEIFKMPKLRALHLGFNQLKSLPVEISFLRRLEWIGLGGNSFREFPVVLLQLPSLREIDLHYNRIKKLPDDLTPLKRLKFLNLRSNQLPPEEKKRISDFLLGPDGKGKGIKLIL